MLQYRKSSHFILPRFQLNYGWRPADGPRILKVGYQLRVDGITLYEIWNGVKPNLYHLRVFGSDVFFHIPRNERGKFDPKTIKCRHVSYCKTQKAFRAWDPVKRKIHISRDVVFYERVLPTCQLSAVFELIPDL